MSIFLTQAILDCQTCCYNFFGVFGIAYSTSASFHSIITTSTNDRHLFLKLKICVTKLKRDIFHNAYSIIKC